MFSLCCVCNGNIPMLIGNYECSALELNFTIRQKCQKIYFDCTLKNVLLWWHFKLYQHQIVCSSPCNRKEKCCSQWIHSCILTWALGMRTPTALHCQKCYLWACKKKKKEEQWTLLIRLKYFITRKTKSVPFSLNEVTEYVQNCFKTTCTGQH